MKLKHGSKLLGMAVAVLLGVASVAGTAHAATSADVSLAQRDLNGLAYDAGAVDGVAGSQTQAATSSFQADRCLSVDGILGPQTLGGLESVVEAVQSKAGTTADGDYGANTLAAVKQYQSSHGLASDGVAGPDTMKSMGIARQVASCHSGGGTAGGIVRIARSQIGTTDDQTDYCVPGKPYNICGEWCAAFATWTWRDAGVSIPFITYVPDVYNWAVANGRWTENLAAAHPGDMIIFGTATDRYHIGIVTAVSGGTVKVTSGDTSEYSDGSGPRGVWEKSYSLSHSVFYGLVTI